MTQPKQVLYTPVEIDDADFVDFERDPKMEEENLEFEQFKDEMHDAQFDAKITVGKKMTDSRGRPLGRQVFECFECGVDDYTFSQLCTRIREDFGTGLYQIHGRDSKGKYKFKKTVGILAPNTPDNAPGTDIGALIDKFSDAMERQAMRTEQLFKSLAGPQSGGDAFDQMTKMMGAMGGMMGAMGINPQAPKSLMDQLTEFKMVQELFGGGDSGGGGASNLYSLLEATVKSFGPALGLAIAAQQKTGAIPAHGPVEPGQPVVPALPKPVKSVKPNDPIQTDDPLSAELEAMRPQINFLVAQAKAGAKAEDVATAIVPGIPENALESIEAFLKKEDCIELCISVNAEIQKYRLWFIDWRDAMLRKIDALFEPDDLVASSDLTPLLDKAQTANVSHSQAIAGNHDSIEDQSEADASASTEKQDQSNSNVAASRDTGDTHDS